MKKSLFTFMLITSLLLAGCSPKEQNPTITPQSNTNATVSSTATTISDAVDDDAEVNEELGYTTLTIQTNLTNPEDKDDSYLVFLIQPGTLPTEPGAAKQGCTPLETDENGAVTIDLRYNDNLAYQIEKSQDNSLQLVVTTQEDIYLRNPLNEETLVQFIPNDDEDMSWELPYYAEKGQIDVDITDKYPDGVVSLTFPDATFVIKLTFEDGYTPSDAYVVTVKKPSDTASDGIGMEGWGRICRPFQYWDTPFFVDDMMQHWSGLIVVTDFDTDERVYYEGFPMQVTFDSDGHCEQGDIVTIKLIDQQ